jgi:hypothetical protein
MCLLAGHPPFGCQTRTEPGLALAEETAAAQAQCTMDVLKRLAVSGLCLKTLLYVSVGINVSGRYIAIQRGARGYPHCGLGVRRPGAPARWRNYRN